MQQARYVVNATVGQRVGSLGVSYPEGHPGGDYVDAARARVCRTARIRKVTLGRAPLTTNNSNGQQRLKMRRGLYNILPGMY